MVPTFLLVQNKWYHISACPSATPCLYPGSRSFSCLSKAQVLVIRVWGEAIKLKGWIWPEQRRHVCSGVWGPRRWRDTTVLRLAYTLYKALGALRSVGVLVTPQVRKDFSETTQDSRVGTHSALPPAAKWVTTLPTTPRDQGSGSSQLPGIT